MEIDKSSSTSCSDCISSDESAVDDYAAELASTFEMLNDEMKGRIEENSESVWAQLEINAVDGKFVTSCCDAVRTQCAEHIFGYNDLVTRRVERQTGVSESKAYPFLTDIFNFIEKFVAPSSPSHQPIREFVRISFLKYDNSTNSCMAGFPEVSPDISVENIEHGLGAKGKSNIWKTTDAFAEVKLDPNDSPSNRRSSKNNILSQSANYARLHMSARPFLLFSIGLLIFGTRFCVCIFDRGGVRISPELDMWDNLDKLVRVIRSLTCDLDAEQIGQDPTARLVMEPKEPDFYVVKPIGKDGRSWRTIGSPIWSSLSLFGRGTVVWKVVEYNEQSKKSVGPTMIMKSAWRSAHRNPESSLSRYVTAIANQNPEVSVAEFVTGGDVYMEGGSPPDMTVDTDPPTEETRTSSSSDSTTPKKTLITVPFLRGAEVMTGASPILHRVITKTVGRPLWEYADEQELAKAFIAILRSHKRLCELNVLHRDISPGNMLLAEDLDNVDDGHEAFLSDFELARVGDGVGVYVYERVGSQTKRKRDMTPPDMKKTKLVLSGSGTGLQAPITGTLQFMAVDLLNIIASHQNQRQSAPIVFKQDAHHDLESIVLVFAYILLRKMIFISAQNGDEDEAAYLKSEFKKTFGRMTVREIRLERREATAFEWIESETRPESVQEFLARNLSEKLIGVCRLLYGRMFALYTQKRLEAIPGFLVARNRKAGEEEEFSHDELIEYFSSLLP
ncbi:hypothetical protein SCHPADRAFT_908868 [Schizopora paradoxa]|uniref:Protein kinase domain-containing protein n=1 Tax=Schizopora paradoxa TaxID=27342 RepID=A0A0H2REZ8_9AGAM|nr:hypothetical protein SCHPADRAFT_908868 [Schizopora paradoxa]